MSNDKFKKSPIHDKKVMKKKLESLLSKMKPVEILLMAITTAFVIVLIILVLVITLFF
jgi:hypothetical protein